ncbi:MAG: LptA/OstA family protein [Cyanobacteria bacterium P01_A01_bin.84]
MILSPKSLKYRIHRFGLAFILPVAVMGTLASPSQLETAKAQAASGNRPLTIRSDVQEYDAKTQVITARGNVQLLYPSRQIKATAAQAQYFNNERRIVMSGDVYILQNGNNSIRGETVTYLIDEGKFVALPKSNRQVESIYIIDDANPSAQRNAPAPKTPGFKRTN